MAQPEATLKTSRFVVLASIAVVIASLYLAQELLVPIALAMLFSFLLAPLVHGLERLKLPRAVAVLLTVLVACGSVGAVGYTVYDQMADFARQLPQYRENIQAKVKSFKSRGGIFANMKQAGEEVQHILNVPASGPSTTTTVTPPGRPVPVVVTNTPGATNQPASSPWELIALVGGKLLGPVGTSFIVVVFTIFMLIQREDLRDRVIRLVGRSQLTATTEALDDAAARVSRYLLMQSLVNTLVGIAVMLCLWGVGRLNRQSFPSPALWGLLAALLRFIPYVGIWIAAVTPILLSLAVFSGAGAALETIGSYAAIELLAANLLEPLLFGSSTGLSTLAVLMAAAFWTWLWGPVGLLLSTPMTVCLVVLGKYVPGLGFLTVLLADEPALQPPDRVYQRLLAEDDEEAERLVDEYARKLPLEELYDTVLIPALAMAERDRHVGNLDEEHHANVRRGLREIVDELGDRQRTEQTRTEAQGEIEAGANPDPMVVGGNGQSKPATGSGIAQPPPGSRTMLPRGCTANVVCLSAHGESDEIAAIMLAQLLEIRGYCALTVSVEHLTSEMVTTVEQLKADLVCISALPPGAVRNSRYLCKRLNAKMPELAMVVGLWGATGDVGRLKDRIAGIGNIRAAASFAAALHEIQQMVRPKPLEDQDVRSPSGRASPEVETTAAGSQFSSPDVR